MDVRSTPARKLFPLIDQGRLLVVLDEKADWDRRQGFGSFVEVRIGPDAAFPLRYVGYSFGTEPAALLEPIHGDELAVIEKVLAASPDAAIELAEISTRRDDSET